jgi:hypothetical protein
MNHTTSASIFVENARMAAVQSPVIPGSTFGMTDRCALRVSYGPLNRDTALEGMGRLVRGLRAILRS